MPVTQRRQWYDIDPPEIPTGPACRFGVCHVMQTDKLEGLFPVRVEDI